jgi:dolichol-phosphate mannosyltransferase
MAAAGHDQALAHTAGQKTLILVPTYNEAENIGLLINSIYQECPSVDILFIDDNSSDGTQESIREHQARHPNIFILSRPKKLGLGTAYIAGFEWGLKRGYDILIEMDADLSHDPKYLPRMLAELQSFDFAIGSRYCEGGSTRNWGVMRKIISRGGSLYARMVLGVRFKDLTGGFNGWRRSVLEKIGPSHIKSEGYSFQIELKYRAQQAGFKGTEFPIEFVDRRAGHSKMSTKIMVEALFRLWRLKWEISA